MVKSRKLRTLVVVALLAIFGVATVAVADLIRSAPAYLSYQDKLASITHHTMEPMPVNPSWVLSGAPKFSVLVFADVPHLGSSSGIWQCDGPGKFIWKYGVDESIYILDGSVELEYLGKKLTLRAGDSTFFAAGTEATWTVTDHVRKTFRIYEASRVTRLMRRVMAAVGID